ncbi:hypothetical protein FQN57_004262 [Myotisia sp. PD_48]|nr:hypothetical protein FQN57_004262 [Myotisia sp. PD_48]
MPARPSTCLLCTFRETPLPKLRICKNGLLDSVRRFSSSSQKLATSRTELQSAEKYCVDLLQKYDRPSFTLSTFVPRHTTKFYIALHALNVSLSMIPETTSTQTIGLMRLQFWRDTITRTLAGNPPKEPIAILLASALSDLDSRTQGKAKISKAWLMRLINAREQHLTLAPYPNLSSLESYAEQTYSTLSYLMLSALPLNSLTADHLASHIGKASGITALLRGVPLIAFPPPPNHHSNRDGLKGGISGDMSGSQQGAVILPLDVMAQAGVKEEEVFRQGADAPGLRDAVFAVATRASDHLITARQMLKNIRAGEEVGHDFEHHGEEGHEYQDQFGDVPGQTTGQEITKTSRLTNDLHDIDRSFGLFLPAVSTNLWLNKLQKVDFDIFKPELLSTDWRLPWKAYWAYKRRTF